jgi:predicted DNA-binding transcriptional regulator AlpA
MLRDYQSLKQTVEAVPSFDGTNMVASHAEVASVATVQASESDLRMPHEKLLGAKDVAHWLGVSRAWVFEHSNGRRRPFLPSVKLGKSVRYRPVDVDAFIIECERFSRRGAA